MATGSIMISGLDDHYFDKTNELVGCNKSRFRELFVLSSEILCGRSLKNQGR